MNADAAAVVSRTSRASISRAPTISAPKANTTTETTTPATTVATTTQTTPAVVQDTVDVVEYSEPVLQEYDDEPIVVENKALQFSASLGDAMSSGSDTTDTALAEMVRAQRAALDVAGNAVAVRTTGTSNTCDADLRKCMTDKCGNNFTKCASDTDTMFGTKLDSCRRNTKCDADEYRIFTAEIKADRISAIKLKLFNDIIDCGKNYDACIVNQCGATYAKCLGKSAGDTAISKCGAIAKQCNTMDSGLASRTMGVFATLRQTAEKQISTDEKKLYTMRDQIRNVCSRLGAMLDERSLDCVYTVNFIAGEDSTLYSSKKAYAGNTFDCTPAWFGVDITTYMENAYRATREQSAASSAMLGSGVGMAVGALTSGAIGRAVDRQQADKELCEAKDGMKWSSFRNECVEDDSEEKEAKKEERQEARQARKDARAAKRNKSDSDNDDNVETESPDLKKETTTNGPLFPELMQDEVGPDTTKPILEMPMAQPVPQPDTPAQEPQKPLFEELMQDEVKTKASQITTLPEMPVAQPVNQETKPVEQQKEKNTETPAEKPDKQKENCNGTWDDKYNLCRCKYNVEPRNNGKCPTRDTTIYDIRGLGDSSETAQANWKEQAKLFITDKYCSTSNSTITCGTPNKLECTRKKINDYDNTETELYVYCGADTKSTVMQQRTAFASGLHIVNTYSRQDISNQLNAQKTKQADAQKAEKKAQNEKNKQAKQEQKDLEKAQKACLDGKYPGQWMSTGSDQYCDCATRGYDGPDVNGKCYEREQAEQPVEQEIQSEITTAQTKESMQTFSTPTTIYDIEERNINESFAVRAWRLRVTNFILNKYCATASGSTLSCLEPYIICKNNEFKSDINTDEFETERNIYCKNQFDRYRSNDGQTIVKTKQAVAQKTEVKTQNETNKQTKQEQKSKDKKSSNNPDSSAYICDGVNMEPMIKKAKSLEDLEAYSYKCWKQAASLYMNDKYCDSKGYAPTIYCPDLGAQFQCESGKNFDDPKWSSNEYKRDSEAACAYQKNLPVDLDGKYRIQTSKVRISKENSHSNFKSISDITATTEKQCEKEIVKFFITKYCKDPTKVTGDFDFIVHCNRYTDKETKQIKIDPDLFCSSTPPWDQNDKPNRNRTELFNDLAVYCPTDDSSICTQQGNIYKPRRP